ncbi:5130_t:CDS:2 [Funneliformis geosporum]|uniref:Trafficking protein particle complex subunit n=1 Tax=Funneliformis geosporum TaxID=1117311 RepID=A0A9W4SH41_9GLOM|nr:4429_t:CDS:2 [Funneliformis geosporum]CAI2168702.1 5130_t:CDS:2 [Funneliformis geosporum]
MAQIFRLNLFRNSRHISSQQFLRNIPSPFISSYTTEPLFKLRPAPVPLANPREQKEFEELVRKNHGSFTSVNVQMEEEELTSAHPDLRQKPSPQFEGDKNPKTGEIGGPKQEPLIHAGGLIYQKDFVEGLNKLTSNEYLVLAGTFHGVHAITSKISPVRNATSSGLEVLEADTFKLYCYQTLTGTKFLIIAEPTHGNIDLLLRRTYDIYCDYVMKNPFYTPEMPIKSELFDSNLAKLIKQVSS